MRWLSQVASITLFNLRSMVQRKGSSAAAIFGIAGVVLVFVAVLSIAQGFQHAMTASGREDTAIVLRSGATSEMMSGLAREETRIIAETAGVARSSQGQVASPELLLEARALLDEVFVDDKILDYVLDLVFATRDPEQAGLPALKPQILYGASPRASIALVQAARARAFLEGRGYVTPHDIKSVGLDVLRHRVITTYEAEAEGLTSEDVVQSVFDAVRVP